MKNINLEQTFYLGEDNIYHQDENTLYKSRQFKSLKTVLMVAEKPSISRAIAKAICVGKFNPVQGVSKYLPIFEFEGSFMN